MVCHWANSSHSRLLPKTSESHHAHTPWLSRPPPWNSYGAPRSLPPALPIPKHYPITSIHGWADSKPSCIAPKQTSPSISPAAWIHELTLPWSRQHEVDWGIQANHHAYAAAQAPITEQTSKSLALLPAIMALKCTTTEAYVAWNSTA